MLVLTSGDGTVQGMSIDHTRGRGNDARSHHNRSTGQTESRPMSHAVATPAADPTQDEVFTILKNQRRRRVIRYLKQNGGAASLREVTAEIAATENDVSVEELSYNQRKVVYVSLYQTHIPRLEEADVIEYDHRSGMLTLTDEASSYDVHLAVADGAPPDVRTDMTSQRFAVPLVGAANLTLAVIVTWVLATEGPSVSLLAGTGIIVATVLTVASWYYWYHTTRP